MAGEANKYVNPSETEWETANRIIERLSDYLAESHEPELATCHEGDENHTGEAPESCSYCNAIDEARTFLASVE